MDSINTTIDDSLQFTIHTIKGKVSPEEIIDKIKTYSKNGPTELVLWDFSKADLSNIKFEHVETCISLASQYLNHRNSGKTALVFSSDVGYGLGRIFETRIDIIDSKIPYMTFRNKKDALKWLFK
jgi:hypothetical protein